MSARDDYPWHSADKGKAVRAWSYVSAEAQWGQMCDEIDRLRALAEGTKEQWILCEQENTALRATQIEPLRALE